MKEKKNFLLPIAVMFLLFFVISFATNLNGPFGKILKEQFEFSNMQSQLGTMIFFLSYLFMGIPSSWLIQARGYKNSAVLALLLASLSTFGIYLVGKLALYNPIEYKDLAIYLYLGCNFLLGAAMCVLNNVVNPMLTILGSKEGANQRLNFGGAMSSFGGTLAPAIGGLLIGGVMADKVSISAANPLLFLALGIFLVVGLALYFIHIPEPPIAKHTNRSADKVGALSFNHLRFGIIAIFFYVGMEVTIPNIGFLYMTDVNQGLGIDTATAGLIVGTYWLLMLFGRLIGGLLGKVYTSRQMLLAVSALILLLLLGIVVLPEKITVLMPAINSHFGVDLLQVPVGVMLLAFSGLCTSVMWPTIFNLSVDGLGKYTNQGSGLFMTMVFGGGVIPFLHGYVADLIGFQLSYLVPIVSATIILCFGWFGYKNVNKDILV